MIKKECKKCLHKDICNKKEYKGIHLIHPCELETTK